MRCHAVNTAYRYYVTLLYPATSFIRGEGAQGGAQLSQGGVVVWCPLATP